MFKKKQLTDCMSQTADVIHHSLCPVLRKPCYHYADNTVKRTISLALSQSEIMSAHNLRLLKCNWQTSHSELFSYAAFYPLCRVAKHLQYFFWSTPTTRRHCADAAFRLLKSKCQSLIILLYTQIHEFRSRQF